jgi:hypothetical protein
MVSNVGTCVHLFTHSPTSTHVDRLPHMLSTFSNSLVFFPSTDILTKSRDSSVGIALGYGLDDQGCRVRFPAGLGIFFFTTASRTALGPNQSPNKWVPGDLPL